MVVVPTSHHVRLWYGTTPIDVGGWLLSLLGLAGLVLLIRRPLAPVVAVLRPGFGRRLSFSEVAGGDIKGTWPGGWTPGTPLAGPPLGPRTIAGPEPCVRPGRATPRAHARGASRHQRAQASGRGPRGGGGPRRRVRAG